MHRVHTYISSYFCFIVCSFCAAFKVSVSVEGIWKSFKLYFKVQHSFLHLAELPSLPVQAIFVAEQV